MTNLTNFDIKTISEFLPQSAKKEDGYLLMYFNDEFRKAQIGIQKENTKNKQPTKFYMNISAYHKATNKNYNASLTIVKPIDKKQEDIFNFDIDDLNKTDINFVKEFFDAIAFLVVLSNQHYMELNGAYTINVFNEFTDHLNPNVGATVLMLQALERWIDHFDESK